MSRTEFGSKGQGSVSGVGGRGMAGRRGRRAETSNWKFSCATEAPQRPPSRVSHVGSASGGMRRFPFPHSQDIFQLLSVWRGAHLKIASSQ